MKNIEYIYRTNDGHVYNKEDTGQKINIKELLEKQYSYIYDSIRENNYKIRLNGCDQYKELLFNQKVVGFVTYNKLNKSTKLLTNIYIIEGYRRNRIFTEEIKKQYNQSQKINIYEPNKLLTEVLQKLGYAKQINKTLLISAINFNMQLSNSQTNSKEKLPEKLKITNLYDTNICATVSFKIFTKDKYTVYYTQLQEEDKNKCLIARNTITENYFDNMVNTIIEQDIEIQRWLYILRHNLPEHLSLEDLIGTENKLPKILKEKLENNQLNPKEIKTIQNQIKLELRTNIIDIEAVPIRLQYLAENMHNKKQAKNTNQDPCPYCYEEKPSLEHYCTTCGYKFFDLDKINSEEFVYKYLLDQKQSYKYSLTGIQEAKNFFEEKYRKILAVCDIINETSKYNLSHEIFLQKAREYNITHINLEELMIKNNYVTFNMNPEKWDMESKNYKNNELKEILRKHNCKVSGNKYELIQRIKEEVPLENIKSDIIENTNEGIEFYNENVELIQFHRILSDYIFDEYIDYINNKQDVSEDALENFTDFLQKHVEYANENQDHDQLVNSLMVQSKIYTHQDDYNKFLENEVKILILNLNMYYINPHYYPYYKPVNKLSWEVIYQFRDMFTNEELEETINRVYALFDKNKLKVNFYDMLEVFKDIFKHYSYTGLNGWVQRKYYKHSYNHIHDVKLSKSQNITTLDQYF